METWSSIPEFNDENAKVRTKEHRASGAEITEVTYGAKDPEGNPTEPEKFYADDYDDGHGTWTGIKLGDVYHLLSWKKPASEGETEFLDRTREVLSEIDAVMKEKKTLVDQAFENLKNNAEGSEAFAEIQEKFEKLRTLNVPREIKLNERFAKAVEKNEQRKARIASYLDNKTAKEALVKEAEDVAAAGQWKIGNARMKELMDSWKKLGYAGPVDNDKVWEAFQAARQKFYDAQRAWYDEMDKQHAKAKELKKSIIEEARAVSENSEEWNKTTEKLGELFARWKEAGSAGRDDDNKLWAQFQAVRKAFYDRRTAWFDARNARWKESADTKKSLIEEAREVLENNNFTRAAADRMKQMSVEWKAAGSAGHETDEGLWKAFREIQDKFWESRREDNENRHAQWKERMDGVIQSKKKQIADLYSQNKKLRTRADYSATKEDIDQCYAQIDGNLETIKTLESDIEDIQKRLEED